METEQVKDGVEHSKTIKKIVARVLALSVFVVTAGMTVGCAGPAGSAGAGTSATASTSSTATTATTASTSSTASTATAATTEAEATSSAVSAVTASTAATASTASAAEEAAADGEEADFEPVFRKDKKFSNVRFLTEGQYEFKELDEKYGVPSDFVPSTEGMDSLNISGSSQFSEEKFRELAEELREKADGRQIYVIDTRQESHMLVNGNAISWYAYDNCSNEGLDAAQVEAAEIELFEPLLGTTVTAYDVEKNEKEDPTEIDVTSLMTERELVESEGFTYIRLPVQDHGWTQNEELVDSFIEFVQGIDRDNSWLHFHCQAGKGRTGTYMVIYDMMKNPEVPLEDIVVREAMTGSSYLLEEKDSDPSKSPHAFRAMRIQQIYEYIRENHDTDYKVKWSDWIAQKEAE